MVDKYTEDFNLFWQMIENGNNFTFLRFADGEVLLMEGKSVGYGTQALEVDNWSSPNTLTKVGKELKNVFELDNDNVFYAISSKSDNLNDYHYLSSKVKNQKNITFANLWINANYKSHREKLMSLKRPVTLICNKNASKTNIPFNVDTIIPFPDDCVNFWEHNSDHFLNELISYLKDKKNHLFFICCGPVSEIIIHYLYKENNQNTYIDMGSSIDEFIHNKKTRPYMYENGPYSQEKSYF